ncbi:MAG: nicotinate-nucleotide adenylyltransferase [Alphaproteobacteria bacterium]|jgi:nicotinate-nucleotide adenylyltransferase|nr:nicotinate-nucleotide adenylyltransferase [Alphaproteobacteria bacterium]
MAKRHKMITSKDARVGLFGGSFNPAHVGHLQMSLYALQRLKLDQIWWLVSPQNPLKTRDEMHSLSARIARAKEVADGEDRIVVTSIEATLKTRYTIDSLRALKVRFPRVSFVWLMGEDNLASIHLWKSWQQIFVEVPIAVFRRSGYSCDYVQGEATAFYAKAKLPLASVEDLAVVEPPAWVILDNTLNPLSASQIRQQSRSTSSTNPSNEGVLKMVAKKPAAKKTVKKPAAKKAVKKPAAKKAVKKPAAKKAVKKPAAKKVVKKAVKKPAVKKAVKKVVKKAVKKPAAKKKVAKK